MLMVVMTDAAEALDMCPTKSTASAMFVFMSVLIRPLYLLEFQHDLD